MLQPPLVGETPAEEPSRLLAYMEDCRGLVVDEIREIVPRDARAGGLLYGPLLDYPRRGGKALRPALCIATCRALGGHLEAVLRAEGEDLTGGVAVMSSLTGERAEHFLRAASGDAVALIRITDELDHDGSPLNEVGHTLQGSTFPAVGVDQPTGDWLRERLGQSVRLDVVPDVARGHTSQNVTARVEGTGTGTVFVVAHYDSWHGSHSAFDNGIGVGALIAIAEQVAAGPSPEKTVVFLATSGEEQGLQGAFAWAAEHAGEIGPGDKVVTLDVLWSGEGQYLCMGSTEAERSVAMQAAAAEGLDAVEGGDPGVASDHFPLVLEGATATWCGRWPDRHYHTHRDVMAELDLVEAEAAARVQWAIVDRWMRGGP